MSRVPGSVTNLSSGERWVCWEGDTISMTYAKDGDGVEGDAVARGTFVRLTGSAITVQPDTGTEREIVERDIHRIVRERKDSVWKGAFIGAGVGLACGALTFISFCRSAWECEARPTAGYVLVVSGIGFAVGAAIDAAVGKTQEELVYLDSPPGTGSVTVSLAPILSREQRGVLVTVTW